jgi:hypothetical protein
MPAADAYNPFDLAVACVLLKLTAALQLKRTAYHRASAHSGVATLQP